MQAELNDNRQFLIDRIAYDVVKEGPQFESHLKSSFQKIPEYSFLFEPVSVEGMYYHKKLWDYTHSSDRRDILPQLDGFIYGTLPLCIEMECEIVGLILHSPTAESSGRIIVSRGNHLICSNVVRKKLETINNNYSYSRKKQRSLVEEGLLQLYRQSLESSLPEEEPLFVAQLRDPETSKLW